MFLGERLSKIKPSKQFVFVQALPPERVGESFEERTEYALHASAMHNSTIARGELKRLLGGGSAGCSGPRYRGLTLPMKGTLS